MPGVRTVAVALGLCLSAAPLRAGVYNPAEPKWQLSDTFATFRTATLIPLRQFGTAEGKGSAHRRYALLGLLASRPLPENLTLDQRLSLSAYLIREGKHRDAINALAPALRDPAGRKDFLVYANLATAEYLDGQRQRGRDYLDDGLRMWPARWSQLSKERQKWLKDQLGWDEKKFEWYRRAETYLQKLFRARARERPPAGGQVSPLGEDVDAIFTDDGKPPRPVRFVGEGGKFEAGKIAPAELRKLPEDAVQIVEQLLIWMPRDLRLYWLLGEVLNARKEHRSAAEVFVEVAQTLQSASEDKTNVLAAPQKVEGLSQIDPKRFTRLPDHYKHRLEVVLARVREDDANLFNAPPQPPGKGKQGPAGGSGEPPPLDVRSLGVGFVGGLLVMLFGLWQVREIRRRLGRNASRGPDPLMPSAAAGPREGPAAQPEEGRPG
jgi:hypothetical protein